jgi:hypothetical protein
MKGFKSCQPLTKGLCRFSRAFGQVIQEKGVAKRETIDSKREEDREDQT